MERIKDKWNWKLQRWVKHDLPYLHLEFSRGIKNLWRWFPVIWKDRDWDGYYIFEILKTKLKNQAEYIGSRDLHTRSKRDSEIMLLCVRLMGKVQEEFYSSEYMDYHESRYNWLDSEDRPDCKQLEIEEISENYDEYLAKHKLAVKKVISNPKYQIFKMKEDDGYKQRLAMNVSHYNHNRARKILFKLMERNIEGWWD
jgi:hypothetical protein